MWARAMGERLAKQAADPLWMDATCPETTLNRKG
jgi:hypothetical protein